MSPTLYWVDVETTGLDPARDALLEVAVYRASLDAPTHAERVLSRVLPHVRGSVPVDPKVDAMHERSGLWHACSAAFANPSSARLVAQVLDDDLCAACPEVEDPEERALLAGSTVHFDRGFLRRYLPRFEARLSYRNYDATAVKFFCRGLGMPKIPKGEAHRAEADVLESIEHVRRCGAWLEAYFQVKALASVAEALPKPSELSRMENDGDQFGLGWNAAVVRTKAAIDDFALRSFTVLGGTS